MKNKLFLATAILAFAACSENTYMGDQEGNVTGSGAITFGFDMQNGTRAGDIMGNEAAKLLGNNFYVTGTKGTEAETSPSPTLVFDNYLVHYNINSAGKTTSNTANWEYVGVTPDGTNYDKLGNYQTGEGHSGQTIKFWDYSADQYDFLAFSTGNHKALETTTPAAGTIGVTAMNYGTDLASSGVAYTFYLPDEDALAQAYISDIKEVPMADYQKEVQLKFKSLGSKVRVALYETVPGYSVKDVVFYSEDGTGITGAKTTAVQGAALISATSIPTKGRIDVIFPHVGKNNDEEADYNKAIANVTPGTDPATYKTFGALTAQLVAPEADEAVTGNVYLGRTLPTASFAGNADNKFYLSVFPVSTPAPLTLRVDYTLVPIDGAAETITVKGAKAVVPSTYTKWLPNYAYTYIFKISDNTNGWTGAADKPGLFPITFDAVVTEATDANAEQTTITTVATPSITTYQQGHNAKTDGSFDVANEYSIGKGKDVYVQVMQDGSLVGTLAASNSLLYKVSDADATEAEVMDALENRTSELATANVTGRNEITLTNLTAPIDNTVTSIENGVDDNPISVTAGQAAKIAITSTGFETGTYAYVYDWTTTLPKGVTTIWQPIAANVDDVIAAVDKYVTTAILDDCAGRTAANETVNSDEFLYFSKTKNGTDSWTYSFVSVDGKTTLPAGLVKCPVGSLLPGNGSTTKVTAGTFVFTTYKRNTGKYAVKVIKILA